MPLFSNKFTPKKTPVRKFVSSSFNETERAMNDMTTGDSIVMHLGNTETVFKKGTWSFETGVVGSIQKENYKLRKQIQQLEDEKNLLHLKYEILLNLCTQATVESHLKDCEIESLKKIS